MYQSFISIGLSFIYLLLFLLLPWFFYNTRAKPNAKSIASLIIIALVSLLSYFIALNIPNEWLGNRIQHIFGGGFLSFLICFFVVKDAGLRLTKFQFFIFSYLIVTILGVGNELIEFFLQSYFDFTFARTVDDTWLDLTSNAIGALIAAAIFIPLIKADRAEPNRRSKKPAKT